jgi:outer membrane protein OmpA-like peptidoglycan-associated protein
MKKIVIAAAAAALVLAGCAGMNRQQKGTMIGAAGGAALGAAVSHGSVWGVLIGAALGGAAGNLIGRNMDKQAQELEQAVPTAEVQRVGEGVNMTFQSGLMFKINSAALSDSYKDDLKAAADVFKKYPDTNLLIEGHTDDTGTDAFNMSLSEKRARAVADFLAAQGVDRSRMEIKWYGETQPKYPNDSEENRSKNRRVEIGIYANDEMKSQAKAGTL